MSIASVYNQVKNSLNSNVTLIAVSKTYPEECLQQAYNAGARDFGESKVQELTRKYENLPKDITWHMIGHLQTNKVKYIAPFVSLIHSVDSLKLLQEINKQARKNNRTIDVLLEVHVAREQTKSGLTPLQINELMAMSELAELENIKVRGLMSIGTFTDDESITRSEFEQVKNLFDKYPKFDILSMGMSGDYQLAVEYGSTMVRVGSMIFGARDYSK